MAESLPEPIPLLQRPVVQSLLLQAATLDRETGCLTAAYLAQRASEEIARRQRYGGRLSLLLAAPDEAEEAGDGPSPVARVAARIRARLRATDLAGRWDGQEIVVLLPGTGLAGASRLARRIVAPGAGDAPDRPLLLSIGVATWLGAAETLGLMVERARGGLVEARARGGGRVGVS